MTDEAPLAHEAAGQIKKLEYLARDKRSVAQIQADMKRQKDGSHG